MLDEDLREDLKKRRDAVLAELADDALVLFSAPVHLRNGDVEHPYRQHSDFLYLTGFDEPEAALVLRRREPSYVLFVRPRNPDREQWEGRRAGTLGAVEIFNADEAFPISDFADKIADLLEDVPRVHYHFGVETEWDRLIFSAVSAVKRRRRKRVEAPTALVDAGKLLHEKRRIKTDYEVRCLRAVSEVTARAHRRAMSRCRSGMAEYELQAELEHEFRRAGARREAYEPIVGSGENATILHYRDNNRAMKDGDLVLIDAGTEIAYQSADITRTFPVSGTFTPAQRKLYEVVLRAQAAAFELCVPGKTLGDVHQAARSVIQRQLAELKLIGGDEEELDKGTSRFFMHKTSHYLGMDVHDVGPYYQKGELVPLEPGVVITVEPGVYVQQDDDSVPEEYRGIGIRIEDDVLITGGAPEVLTNSGPREVEEVEALCQSAS